MQVSEYEGISDALFRLRLWNESSKSRFIPLLLEFCNHGCDIAPVGGRNFGCVEFVEHALEVVKRRDRGADTVVFPGNIFAGRAKQDGTFSVDNGKAAAVEFSGKAFIGRAEGALDAAALQKAALHSFNIDGGTVVAFGLRRPTIRPEGIDDLNRVVRKTADAVLE